MDLGLNGKVALVGGASRGLGYAIARSLSREGAQVIVLATYREGAWDALAAKATDYVLIDSGSEQVVRAIRRAARGGADMEVAVSRGGG